MFIKLTTKPTVFPDRTSSMRDYLRVGTSEDKLIKKLIERACLRFAAFTNGRQCADTVYDIYFDLNEVANSEILKFPIRPVKTIDAIVYYQEDGTETAVTSDQYHFFAGDRELRWDNDFVVTSVDLAINRTFKVTVTAGYDVIPTDIITGLEQYIVYLYEHRGDVMISLPEEVASAWEPYVIQSFGA